MEYSIFRPARPATMPSGINLVLSNSGQRVYDTSSHEEIGIDDVIRQTGLPSSAVSVALLSLEMKRLVRQLPGKLFAKNG